jgi:hypothetical protein
VLSLFNVRAQEGDDYVLPKYWTTNVTTQFGLSQVALTDWAAGGYGSFSLSAYLDAKANYKKEKILWDNRFQFGYGILNNFGEGLKKTDDRIILDSKFGFQVLGDLSLSAIFNFQTQISKGYKTTTESDMVSNFMAPGYTSLGIGLDYKPNENFYINLAPITGKINIVTDSTLRVKYGNMIDQPVKFMLGPQLKMFGQIKKNRFNASSTLTLFANYFEAPFHVDVNWDVAITAQLSKFLAFTLRTYLIYDRDVKFKPRVDADGNPVLDENGVQIKDSGVQFKEMSSISFIYTFGGK